MKKEKPKCPRHGDVMYLSANKIYLCPVCSLDELIKKMEEIENGSTKTA